MLSIEVRERAVRMVFEHPADYESQWAAIESLVSVQPSHLPPSRPTTDTRALTHQAFWFEHIRAWSVSGLAQADYCQRQGLPLSSFGYWRRRQRELAEPLVNGLQFVPVQVAPQAPASSLTVRGQSWSLDLPATIPASWLADLLRGLG